MKKFICSIIVVASLATMLLACGGEKFTCDLCQEEKSGKKHSEEAFGVKITYCDDCYKELMSSIG